MFSSGINPFLASFLAIVALSAIGTPAWAGDGIRTSTGAGGQRIARVTFADLDLVTADGQHVLKKRINQAVTRVCQKSNRDYAVERACRMASSHRVEPLVTAAIERKGTQLAMARVR